VTARPEPIVLSFALDRPCEACDGTGELAPTAEREEEAADWDTRWRAACDAQDQRAMDELQAEEREYDAALWCGECEGRGLVLTSAGSDLLKFVRRWGAQ
jgi:hypothetical protein